MRPSPRLAALVVTVVLVGTVAGLALVRDDAYVAVPGEGAGVPPAADVAGATATLRDLQDAVGQRDPEAAADLATPESAGLLSGVLANAEALDVADFSLRYVDQTTPVSAEGRWSAAVDASWRFDGFDSEPVRLEMIVDFEDAGEEVRIAGLGGGDRRSPLWLSGPVEVRRGPDTLVLAASADVAESLAARAETAVGEVREVVPSWQDGLVVEAPADSAGLDAMLAAEPGTYAGIAAVAATVDGLVTPTSPTHVFVNPDLYAVLGEEGEQVVMTHEATHIATSAPVVAGMPAWLVEGFADYVALRDTDLPLTTTAGQILEQVRADGAPPALPGPSDFDPSATHLGAVYEAAWLACEVVADRGGEQALVRFYDDVRRGADADRALRARVGFGVDRLTELWRQRLEVSAERLEAAG